MGRRTGAGRALTQPYKKVLPYKKALTIQQYELIRLAHESPVLKPQVIPPVNLNLQASGYNPPPVIRLPQVAIVPAMQIPSYRPSCVHPDAAVSVQSAGHAV